MIALWDRFNNDKDARIHLLPGLQELGTNGAISETQIPTLSQFERESRKFYIQKLIEFYKERLIMEQEIQSFGQKSLEEDQNLECLCDWAFRTKHDTVIICGHSNWFDAFLRKFASETEAFANRKDVESCSVVGFRMICNEIPDGTRTYEIVSRSISSIYRGFK